MFRLYPTSRNATDAEPRWLSDSHTKLRFQTVIGLSFLSREMTKVISQLFKVKYVSAKRRSPGRIALTGDGCLTSGSMWATKKNKCDDSQREMAGAATLKSARCGSSCLLEIQKETTRASRATTTVPAAGP